MRASSSRPSREPLQEPAAADRSGPAHSRAGPPRMPHRPTDRPRPGRSPAPPTSRPERRERFERAQRESLRPDEDTAVLYGWHTVKAALENPRRRLRKLLATENVARRLAEEKVPTEPPPQIVRPDAIAARLPPDAVHQGIYAEADPLPSPSIEELAGDGVVLVLDQVTDPHNVGAIFRSAAAFAATAIVTTARHSPEATGVLAKSASGALEHVPLITVQNLARALAALKERGFLVVGLDADGEDELSALPLRRAAGAGARRRRQGTAAIDPGDLRSSWRGSICRARSRASTCRTPPRLRSISRPAAWDRRRADARADRHGSIAAVDRDDLRVGRQHIGRLAAIAAVGSIRPIAVRAIGMIAVRPAIDRPARQARADRSGSVSRPDRGAGSHRRAPRRARCERCGRCRANARPPRRCERDFRSRYPPHRRERAPATTSRRRRPALRPKPPPAQSSDSEAQAATESARGPSPRSRHGAKPAGPAGPA